MTLRNSSLAVLGLLGTAGAIGIARIRRARGSSAPPGPYAAAVGSGIADVDPEPLSNIAGEGIDLDATSRAHRDLRDLRERLPQPGKNLP
jgi:hypothetical protein